MKPQLSMLDLTYGIYGHVRISLTDSLATADGLATLAFNSKKLELGVFFKFQVENFENFPTPNEISAAVKRFVEHRLSKEWSPVYGVHSVEFNQSARDRFANIEESRKQKKKPL